MAESELGVLSAQCLDRRIPDKQILTTEVAAWEQHRNTHHAKADWQFTTADARIKLKRLSVRMTQATSASMCRALLPLASCFGRPLQSRHERTARISQMENERAAEISQSAARSRRRKG